MNQKELVELSGYQSIRNTDFAASGDVSYKEGAVLWLTTASDQVPGSKMNVKSFEREHLRIPAAVSDEKRDQIQWKASLHDLFSHRYVAHMHSPVIDAFMCSRNARHSVKNIFGEDSLFIPYDDPGLSLIKKAASELAVYRQHHNNEPGLIFLENNGIIIAADTAEDITVKRNDLTQKIIQQNGPVKVDILPYNAVMDKVLPVLRMLLSTGNPQVVRSINNTLVEKYCGNQQDFHKIAIPLTPATIDACRTRYMFIDQSQNADRIIESFRYQLPNFLNEYGYLPAIIVIKGAGIFAFAENYTEAGKRLDAFENHIKICHYALQSGGTKYLTPEQVTFIDNNRTETTVTGAGERGKFKNRIAVAAGNGKTLKEIASGLFSKGMNVIVACNNEAAGSSIINDLNNPGAVNKAIFIKTDAGDSESAMNVIYSAVRQCGGLDLLVTQTSVSGEITLENTSIADFASLNDNNNKGFFALAKYASEIMKLQNQADPEHFSDIIRINSVPPSGFNFLNHADEGLTQMFASELAPFRIKVNTIMHGHFFEDPVWSDPRTGILAGYLKSGRISGARNIDDVRKYLESMVPLKRGCRHEDILKAVFYIIDQEYETGQVIKVTGGLSVREL
ncbi:MAG TPA: SDR family oxidoreductase [Bacteroidales bacterium]|nr:SDR family oxidoreductase [Bacteroidales bacterium]